MAEATDLAIRNRRGETQRTVMYVLGISTRKGGSMTFRTHRPATEETELATGNPAEGPIEAETTID